MRKTRSRTLARACGLVLAASLLAGMITGCNRTQTGSAPGTSAGEGAAQAGTEAPGPGSTAETAAAAASSAKAGTAATAAAASEEAGTAATAAAEEAAEFYKAVIAIDPGHQEHADLEDEPLGPESSETKDKVTGGATGVASGVPEYQLVLDIGLALREELEERGYKVVMTRETNNVDISNSERAEIANEAEADALIRIHANSVGDSGHTGAMTICQTPGNSFNADIYEESRALSECVLDAYTLETGIQAESVWETDTMTGINWSDVPVTILEMGYLSNREEDLKMQDPDMRKKMVRGIANGIDAYIVQHPPKKQVAIEAGSGSTAMETAAESFILDPKIQELKDHLEEELAAKSGKWSMCLHRLDTGEEFGINADNPMISASLIKLYIAGCYFEQIDRGVIGDDYPNQLFTMISESNNDSTNTLIDVLGMDTINAFIQEHGFKAGQLNRKMLHPGTENYTSSADCARVLREVYEGTYVSQEASDRIMEAMKAQIARNRQKIPAGVPGDVETANKTGELFTQEDGASVEIQNDAAIIFVPDHPYILTVMTTVPPVSEDEMRAQIAALSAEVYEAVTSAGQ